MKKLTAIILLLLALPLYLAALPTYYDTGSQVFTISAGPTIPFFYYMFLGFSSAYGRWEFFPYTLLVIYCATSFKERKKFKFYEI